MPFFPELQKRSRTMSSHSCQVIPRGWITYGTPFQYPGCLITLYFSLHCTAWSEITKQLRAWNTWVANNFSRHVLVCKRWIKKLKKKGGKKRPPGKREGSCLMEERHEGEEGWNCLLMASLSQLWELQLSGGAETNRGGSCGDHSIQTTAHIFPPCTLFGHNKLIFGLLRSGGVPAGCRLTNM